jgi:hypothetical protein
MRMVPTTRVIWGGMAPNRAALNRPAVGRILYLVVGCLVTIYLWTVQALRASVSHLDLEWSRLAKLAAIVRPGLATARNSRGVFPGDGMYLGASLVLFAFRLDAGGLARYGWQGAQALLFLGCVLTSLCAMGACCPALSTRVVRLKDRRDLKAVRT